MLSRRGFLSGLVSALAAPAIVRIDSIMPVRVPKLVPIPYTPDPVLMGYEITLKELDEKLRQKVFIPLVDMVRVEKPELPAGLMPNRHWQQMVDGTWVKLA